MPQPRRVVSVFCLATLLTLPLAAQTGRGEELPLGSFLSALWDRLTAPVLELTQEITHVWAADGLEPEPPAPPDSTNRGGWDPNG